MKRAVLYHGSPNKLIGKEILPKKAKGLGKKKDKLTGIYATRDKTAAIVMAIISCKGCGGSTLGMEKGKVWGIVYGKLPRKKYVYLYILPSKNFKKIDSWQWASYKPVTPSKIIKISVSKYKKHIRKATKEEKKAFKKLK